MSGFREVIIDEEKGIGEGEARIEFHSNCGRKANRRSRKEIDVIAGDVGTWIFGFKVGKNGISPGGGVAYSHIGTDSWQIGLRPQDINEKGREYVTAFSTGKAAVDLQVNSKDPLHSEPIAKVLVKDGHLKEGDEIHLRIGDTSHGGRGSEVWPFTQRKAKVKVLVDSEGLGLFKRIASSPLLINVVPNHTVRRYEVTCPSVVKAGEKVPTRIKAMDVNKNIVSDCDNTIELCGNGVEGLPKQYVFKRSDKGVQESQVTFTKKGIHTIKLKDKKEKLQCESNPVICNSDRHYKIYWGDLHVHAFDGGAGISDLNPTTHPSSNYRYAREIGDIDFCAITSHVHCFTSKEIQERWWPLTCKAAIENDRPGKYITFVGYEWRGKGGDRCVIFKDIYPKPQIINPECGDLGYLYKRLDPKKSIIIPHVGGAISDWDIHSEDLEPLGEITSMHGNFEWFVQDALLKGYEIGFVGGSDGHVGMPGATRLPKMGWGRYKDYLNRRDCGYCTGSLTAVLARSLTRDAVFDALYARRTYATTGARMIIDFNIDGNIMGSKIRATCFPRIFVSVIGCAKIDKIEVIRNDEKIYVHEGKGRVEEFEFEDKGIEKFENYYYIRVSQVDGEFGWSSPIFVENKVLRKQEQHSVNPSWNEDATTIPNKTVRDREIMRHFKRLLEYLKIEEDPERFNLTPVRMVKSSMGRYALFWGYDVEKNARIHVKWFTEFDDARIRIDRGWRDFGIERTMEVDFSI